MRRALTILLLATTPLLAGEPSPVEDNNFFAESGRNRDDAVLQYTSFFLTGRDAAAYELTQEWAAFSPRHQLSYTIPLYSDGKTGLGDVKINYRHQLVGDADSRLAIAPRVSLVLPTRHAHFGERSSGLEVAVPLSAVLVPRLTLHANAVGTWYRDRAEKEVKLTQSTTFDLTDRIALSLDSDYTRSDDGSHLVVVRPGVQFTIEGPGGVTVTPGVAMPLGARSVLLYVGLERALQ